MLLKNFYFHIVIRVLFIVISAIFTGIVIQNLEHGYYYTLCGMIIFIGLQTMLLIKKVNKTNADLEKFLSSVMDHDTSVRFTEPITNRTFHKLYERLNEMNRLMQNAKIENERSKQFLQCMMDHVDVGLLTFDAEGHIELYNKAAKKYFHLLQPTADFGKSYHEFQHIAGNINPGQEILYKSKGQVDLRQILIKAVAMKFESKVIKLVSLDDITQELDKKELDSWHKIIRVLTHEIMNSISPVTSLTSVISAYFKDGKNAGPIDPEKIDHKIIQKTLAGLNTIEETGKGLLDFVDKYRSLTLLPDPVLKTFTLDELFFHCKLLLEPGLPRNVRISTDIHPVNLSLKADYSQIEQILINLVKNAQEALADISKGSITLKASSDHENIFIQVHDNGSGIPEDIMDQIFVPFFTTKDYGSGIGLSLSKQIMQNHKGAITVNSSVNKGTTFTLKFPI